MRVLVVAGWYPNNTDLIKGVFVREQVISLREAGIDVLVFYPFDENVTPGKMVVSVEDGIKTYRANTLRFQNRYLARIDSYYIAVRFLKEISKKFMPDVIHTHVGFPASIITYLFTRGSNIPYIITEHMSYLKDYAEKPFHRILLKPAFEHANLILPVSPYLAGQIKDFGWKTNLYPIPNLVDTDRFQLRPNVLHDQVNILFVGHMDGGEGKGVQFLLPAFAQVVQQMEGKKLHLFLVGDGTKRLEYEHLTETLRVSELCTFYGKVEPSDMPTLFQNCDFFVLPSLKETFGCVLLESMACGKPVLTTACGGPESFVNDKVGMLVQPGSAQALSQGLLAMIESYKEYDPQEIRQYIIKHYSKEVIARQLISIYKTLLEGKRNDV